MDEKGGAKFLRCQALFVFDRQLLLAELIGDSPWTFDLRTGILYFSDCYAWQAEVLGTESEETGTWLWAWANDAINIPEQQQAVSLKFKNLGEEYGIGWVALLRPSIWFLSRILCHCRARKCKYGTRSA